jgi:hypothetical protein
MVRPYHTCPHDAHIDRGDTGLRIAREHACSADWLRHPGNKDVVGFQEGATKLCRPCAGQIALGSISEDAFSDVSELDKPDIPIRVLVLAFYPVAVRKDARNVN